jgi:hypothetical protein
MRVNVTALARNRPHHRGAAMSYAPVLAAEDAASAGRADCGG